VRNNLTRQVRRAYRQDELADVCTLPEKDFGEAYRMETVELSPRQSLYSRWSLYDEENYYHFRDNSANVLAVAHLDTVVRGDRRAPRFAGTRNGPIVQSGALDDRLGAYAILHLLPRLGITCDWLFTVGEESGQSTAESFKSGKDYDWVIEFDRMGTDVVMYQYEDEDSREAVEASGAVMGLGSFSDIAYLEHLEVKAFNWGIGYRGDYHSEKGYAYLNDTFSMVARYLRFQDQNAGIRMPHEAESWTSYRTDSSEDYYATCYQCGAKDAVDTTDWYCEMCGSCQDCGEVKGDGCLCYVKENASA
jgi:hypothetical protein